MNAAGDRRKPIRRARGGRHALRPPRWSPAARGFRPDIEGLRAVAVVLVLLYHAGVPLFSGGYVGVDVFFVISGFLITGLLVRELDKTGRISLTRFYARRVRRLLPAAVVVLVTVAVLTRVLLSPVQQVDVAGNVVAAGLYVINWVLAAEAVDYFAADAIANPVQHYWSLAVEEQFYLVWPLLLMAVAYWWWRRGGGQPRRVLLATVVLVGVGSFGYSLYATYVSAADAYFSTLTRGWELALGGALALVLTRLPALPAMVVRLLGVAGLLAILWAGLRLSDGTAFPGVWALLPTLGAAALIVAGCYEGGWTRRLLTLAPVRHIGKISYSWYLWHWPVLVFAAELLGGLSALQGVAVAAASYVPALLSYRFVEEPFRRSQTWELQPRWGWRLAFGCTGAAVCAGMVLHISVPAVQTAQPDEIEGAAAADEATTIQSSASQLSPDPLEARDDMPRIDDDGCHLQAPDIEPRDCVYGDESASTSVVAFGDSHMMQYGPALEKLAEQNGWRLPVHVKAGCSPADATMFNAVLERQYLECDEWRDAVLEQIEQEDPDMVIMTARGAIPAADEDGRLDAADGDPLIQQGWVDTLERLRDSIEAEIVVIKDNPQMDSDTPECVSRSLEELEECATPVEEAFDFAPSEARAAQAVSGTHLVDLTSVLCQEGVCPAVIGDVVVYRDNQHLTATFVETMVVQIDEQLPDPGSSA